jgi:hypothetical protein
MRLNEMEIKLIKETIAAYDNEAHKYIFLDQGQTTVN